MEIFLSEPRQPVRIFEVEDPVWGLFEAASRLRNGVMAFSA